ncbi:MAG: glycosyltransferase family 2 protein, partial [Thermoanaerobaculia bacterium]
AAGQEGVSSEIIVVDNASSDRSRDVAAVSAPAARIIALAENVGFAAGMNRGIEKSSGRYVLALNPDCRLMPDFAALLAQRLDARPDAGSASGRVHRAEGRLLAATDRLDSTGLFFTATGRHFDRDSGQEAAGRALLEQEIFGASGAAGFYRREALESARISTGFFDADFFLYREDADLAWRLQRLGWRCLYVPRAVAYHRRRNLPERRRSMSAFANRHSVKNRFLLRINNETPGHFAATLVPTLARDLVVLGACLTVERSSLPAFGWLWKNRKRLWAKRREIAEKVRARRPS